MIILLIITTLTFLSGEPPPCNPAAETALQPPIWHSEGLSSQGFLVRRMLQTPEGSCVFMVRTEAGIWTLLSKGEIPQHAGSPPANSTCFLEGQDHLARRSLFCFVVVLVCLVVPARATHDARCFSMGFYLTGKVNGQMRVSKSTLPLGVKPVKILYDSAGRWVEGTLREQPSFTKKKNTRRNDRQQLGSPEYDLSLRDARLKHLYEEFTRLARD